MNYILAIILILFRFGTVPLHATFDSSTTAVVSWQQPPGIALTCLRVYHVGAEYPAGICYPDLAEGTQVVRLPGALTHPAYRPQMGDRIVLAFGMDDVGETTLGEVPSVYSVYLPLAMQTAAPAKVQPVYLPTIAR